MAVTLWLVAAPPASAQTTVVLNTPNVDAGDVAIQGGQSATTNFERQVLMTRASSNADYLRRALLKFDTETRVPANAVIQSATLTLTVHGGNRETRRLALYYLTEPFETTETTWQRRKSGIAWTRAGGALGTKYAEATVGGTPGSKVQFDVTRLVQDAVNGRLASRWTRMAILDEGSSTSESYREYYPVEATDRALRPTLTIVYGGSGGSTSSGTSTSTSGSSGSTTTTSSGLPSGWSVRDIGGVGAAGATQVSSGRYTVSGSGRDIWDTADGFHFAYRTLSGDGEIVARVDSLQHVHDWTKAGVMIRESLTANARHAYMLVSPGKGLAFQRRTSTGGQSTHTSGGTGRAPQYVRLTRSGSTFRAFRSGDGTNWTEVGSQSISMGSTVYIGLAVTAKIDGALATATFSNVAVRTGTTAAPSPTEPTSSSSNRIRVLHWNIHHGVGTDGRYDLNRLATWMANLRPDVISLNEVERNVSSYGNENQPARIAAMLEQKTGQRWYYHFAQRSGSWSSNGQGNVVLSRFPLTMTAQLRLSCNRSAALAGIVVNGRNLNIVSTHLDDSSSSCRTTQTGELLAWFRGFPEQRILAGDMNDQASSSIINTVTQTYVDAWAKAASDGTATSFSGNSKFGATRNSRIDYVFHSRQASALSVRAAEVYDTRDSRGYMPSDHKPLVVTYDVR